MTEDHSGVSRRKFISTSLGYLASAGLLTASSRSVIGEETSAAPPQTGSEVIYRTLGRTGIRVPIVSMGVMNANNPDVVRASYELGIRHFDTAAQYQYGRNEQMVGNVIKNLGVRDKVIIGTKEVPARLRPDTTAQQVKTRLIELCEGSLRRLKTDYIDILYLHSVSSPEDCSAPGIIEALEELKKQGKIRATGVSTHEAMVEVINGITKAGFYDVVLTTINVAMATNTDLLEAIDNAASKGVGIIAMKTQAGGPRLPNPESLQQYSSSVIATACLKWVLRNENITTAIPGYDNYQHMREDFSVVGNLELTAEEEKFLADNRITLGLGYCHQCRQCLATCPRNVEIPTLMRTHMYAAQYANFHEARATLDDIPRARGLQQCVSCAECVAGCANTVDIARRIDALKMMYA